MHWSICSINNEKQSEEYDLVIGLGRENAPSYPSIGSSKSHSDKVFSVQPHSRKAVKSCAQVASLLNWRIVWHSKDY